ncbi:MAG: hypothetical protein A2X82_04475 [Geobacteraceae bacterium GWC2_55_20]|nr:MAG: hypothetical protein A2X82_04475 [Geobacteraceae bacterium GWC2_55_20]OGU22105.1 MAG: hypothetical protein A2X85_09560 [Geobacteraceae bacterium GWF2_54_21]HBA72335.1 hypothetical protein [Geobacter sp.]HCE67406.1 hypothetical protein [Geobacter sp.]
MNKISLTMMSLALSVCIFATVQAAELLDVKPVVSGTDVSVEISADIPMTFTYYKIPGEARAVVDIADVNPEKIEALIIVNKGIISSISVDNAQISGMPASRVIFNLTSQADISVSASPDRKQLTATFIGSAAKPAPAAAAQDAKQLQASEPASAPIEQKQAVAENKPAPQAQPPLKEVKEEDPLGLDEPPATTSAAAMPTLPPPARSKKLEPVVPDTPARSGAVTINNIVTGDSYIDIRTDGTVGDYKIITLSKPERVSIDIPGARSSLKAKQVPIKKFGITRARVGIYKTRVRVVLDASAAAFPKYTITNRPNALRINFN